jgi:hypothetical protein
MKAAIVAFLLGLMFVSSAYADDADLAKQLSNPVSSLISVPFQYNHDCCYGRRKAVATRSTSNRSFRSS